MSANETGGAQRRGYKILFILSGHEIKGLANAEVAKALNANQATTLRDLQIMQDAGLAEKIEETGRWRLAPKLVQVALAHMRAMEHARGELDEIGNRFSRHPR